MLVLVIIIAPARKSGALNKIASDKIEKSLQQQEVLNIKIY